jgi:hypothetical protein
MAEHEIKINFPGLLRMLGENVYAEPDVGTQVVLHLFDSKLELLDEKRLAEIDAVAAQLGISMRSIRDMFRQTQGALARPWAMLLYAFGVPREPFQTAKRFNIPAQGRASAPWVGDEPGCDAVVAVRALTPALSQRERRSWSVSPGGRGGLRYFFAFSDAWAAARRAIGTRNGEQLT